MKGRLSDPVELRDPGLPETLFGVLLTTPVRRGDAPKGFHKRRPVLILEKKGLEGLLKPCISQPGSLRSLVQAERHRGRQRSELAGFNRAL